MTPADVVREAMALEGTPFHHQGRVPGLALDCAGVPIHIAKTLGLVSEDFNVTGYSPIPDGSTLKSFCDEYLVPAIDPEVGGVILVAWRLGPPQHLGVVVPIKNGLAMIHAESRRARKVQMQRLAFGRAMRLVQAYRFPGVAY